MRPVSDFFTGLLTGIRAEDVSAAPRKPRPRPVQKSPKTLSTPFEFIRRFLMLAIGIGLGALALFAAGNAHKVIGPETHTAVAPPREIRIDPRTLDEVLTIDPSVKPGEWKYIVVHHSATIRGSAQSFDDSHRRERGWRCLGYHFVIGNGTDQGDGVVAAGPRWYEQEAGAHANSSEYNEHGIGICLVGNFDAQPPTPAQWAALKALIKRLSTQYHISPQDIVGHNQIRRGGTTACPGKLLNINELRDGL